MGSGKGMNPIGKSLSLVVALGIAAGDLIISTVSATSDGTFLGKGVPRAIPIPPPFSLFLPNLPSPNNRLLLKLSLLPDPLLSLKISGKTGSSGAVATRL